MKVCMLWILQSLCSTAVNITIIVLNNFSSFCLLSHTMLYVNTEGKSALASVVVSPAGTISRRFAPCAVILTCRCLLQPVTTVASLCVTAKSSSEFMQDCPPLSPHTLNIHKSCRRLPYYYTCLSEKPLRISQIHRHFAIYFCNVARIVMSYKCTGVGVAFVKPVRCSQSIVVIQYL